jgi:hypothetical protein
MKTKAAGSSKTSTNFCQATRHQITEDSNLHTHRCDMQYRCLFKTFLKCRLSRDTVLKSENYVVAFAANCTQESPSNNNIMRVIHMSGKTQFENLYMEIKTEIFPVNRYFCV